MGLGGYLAARSEIEHYKTERMREEREVEECPQDEEDEIVEILEPYGLDRQALQPLIDQLKSDPEKFVDFMMKFELNLECPDPRRSWVRNQNRETYWRQMRLTHIRRHFTDFCTYDWSLLLCRRPYSSSALW